MSLIEVHGQLKFVSWQDQGKQEDFVWVVLVNVGPNVSNFVKKTSGIHGK